MWSDQLSINNIAMCLGRDDGLPLRDAHDKSLEFFKVMEKWRQRETSELKLSTPIAFFHDLEKEKNHYRPAKVNLILQMYVIMLQ